MSDADERKRVLRETLKRLRVERSDQVKAATAASAVVRGERRKIVTAMAGAPMSVPQVAAATELSTDRVLWHIAAMRKYGQLVEAPRKDGGYFTYVLTPQAKAGGVAADGAGKQTDEEGGKG